MHNLGDLVHVPIAVAAVLETKTPVWHHGGETGDLGVLARNLDGAGAGDKVKVENAAEGVVLEVLARLGVLVDYDVHAVRVEEEDAVGAGLAVLIVNGVGAVEVGAGRGAVGIARPQRADVVGGVETEGVPVLAQAVQVGVLGELGAQAEILRLEDQRLGRRVEQNLTGLAARNGEGEGVGLVLELESRLFRVRAVALGARKDGFGDLIDDIVDVLDLDVETVVYDFC